MDDLSLHKMAEGMACLDMHVYSVLHVYQLGWPAFAYTVYCVRRDGLFVRRDGLSLHIHQYGWPVFACAESVCKTLATPNTAIWLVDVVLQSTQNALCSICSHEHVHVHVHVQMYKCTSTCYPIIMLVEYCTCTCTCTYTCYPISMLVEYCTCTCASILPHVHANMCCTCTCTYTFNVHINVLVVGICVYFHTALCTYQCVGCRYKHMCVLPYCSMYIAMCWL